MITTSRPSVAQSEGAQDRRSVCIGSDGGGLGSQGIRICETFVPLYKRRDGRRFRGNEIRPQKPSHDRTRRIVQEVLRRGRKWRRLQGNRQIRGVPAYFTMPSSRMRLTPWGRQHMFGLNSEKFIPRETNAPPGADRAGHVEVVNGFARCSLSHAAPGRFCFF